MKPVTAPSRARDHLWVLFLVAACALAEVWGSWVSIGATTGFPKLGPVPTDWTLAVVVEAYWGYALYAWLGTSAGPRSRRFAMWSAGAVFVLSLVGQAASHLTAGSHQPPPPPVVVFVTALPVIVLALIAVLVDLRRLDRAEAAEVAQESALRAELDAERAARIAAEAEPQALRAELETARTEAAEATAKAETLTRKLATTSGRKSTRNSRPKKAADSPGTGVPKDVDARAEALAILSAEPGISGAKLGKRVGMSERWGQLLKIELATAPQDTVDGNEEAQ